MGPLQLIYPGKSGDSIILNREALKLIESETRPIAVLAIFGPARHGKSSFLNSVTQSNEKFVVSPTIVPETKGIWFIKQDFPGDPERCLIILDTEGSGDSGSSSSHDMKLFTLTLLMSSMFVYSTPGTIDKPAMSTLNLATRISGDVIDDKDFQQYFPHLVWALRDFYLIPRVNGVILTSDQYMWKEMRKSKYGWNKTMLDAMMELFPGLNYFFFSKPVNDEELSELDTIPFKNFKEKFKNEVLQFQQFIRGKIKTKKIGGSKAVTGFDYAKLVERLVEAVQGDNLDIRSTYDYVLEERNRNDMKNLFDKSTADFEKECSISGKSFVTRLIQAYQLHILQLKSTPDVTVAQKVLDSLKFPLMKMFKARKATMATFKFVADELERENVSLKKNLLKLGGRLTSATGGVISTVSVFVTGGAAIIPLTIAGLGGTLLGGGLKTGGVHYGRQKLQRFVGEIIQVLDDDEAAREELVSVLDKLELDSIIKSSLKFRIPEDILRLTESATKEFKDVIDVDKMKAEVASQGLISSGTGMSTLALMDGASGISRVAQSFAKVGASVGVGLSTVCVLWDTVGIYRDLTAESTASSLRKIATKARVSLA